MSFYDVGIGIDFDFANIEEMIQNRGTEATHEIAIPCPCLITDTEEGMVGSPKPGCPKCLGNGYLFRDPRRVTALFENMTFSRSFLEIGWIQPGDLNMTPSIHARPITDYDKITIPIPVSVEPQVIIRGQASPFNIRPPGLEANEDYLLWEAGGKDAIWVEDEDCNTYIAGDYLLNGRRVVWTEGAGPAVGKQYIIKYMAYPEYTAWTTPMENWDRERSLGQRVMLRKLDVSSQQKQILPPWQERLENNAFKSDNGYRRIDGQSAALNSQR